ncbi:hypothetical protein GCM10022211_20110 [Sphingomonas humi]|uniref:SHOCT domain-containing protein n=2 Tax=Sphingomonas humi TaxID=335630 RepID=A0ABP7S5N8_9SPHN
MIGLVLAAMIGSGPLAGTIPVQARPLPSYNPATSADLGTIRRDVRKGREEGSLSRRQARELRRESREVAMLEERYAAGGLSTAEQAELKARIEVLRALTRGKRLGTIK